MYNVVNSLFQNVLVAQTTIWYNIISQNKEPLDEKERCRNPDSTNIQYYIPELRPEQHNPVQHSLNLFGFSHHWFSLPKQ